MTLHQRGPITFILPAGSIVYNVNQFDWRHVGGLYALVATSFFMSLDVPDHSIALPSVWAVQIGFSRIGDGSY
jgi:hypothetical protein